MPSLDLKTKTLKFHATDETAIRNVLALTELMQQNSHSVNSTAVEATDCLKKLLAHVVKARAPKPKPAEPAK